MKWSHSIRFLACLAGCCATVQADEDVLMFGLKIERDDYIGGRVSSTLKLGRTVTIDLGAREGIRPTNRLWIFRRIDGQFRKVGRVEVARTLQQSSVAITENLVRARRGDLVIIPAKELDVWHGKDPLERRIKNRIVEHQISNRYSTFEREYFGRSLLQQLAASRDIKHAVRRYELLRHRPKGPAYFDISILKSMSRQRVDRRPTQFHPDRLAARDPLRVFHVSTGEFIGFPLEVYDPNPEETGNADPTQNTPTAGDALPITDVPELRTSMFEYERLRAFLGRQN
ncbi:MAG: hypothetical protein ABGZ17_30350 [Planctomycetaceae bacterium]